MAAVGSPLPVCHQLISASNVPSDEIGKNHFILVSLLVAFIRGVLLLWSTEPTSDVATMDFKVRRIGTNENDWSPMSAEEV